MRLSDSLGAVILGLNALSFKLHEAVINALQELVQIANLVKRYGENLTLHPQIKNILAQAERYAIT